VTSENTTPDRSQTPATTSENTGAVSDDPPPRRRGARPTPIPDEYAEFLDAYTTALDDVPLADDTKRTYISRVRMYLAWLADPGSNRRSKGDPLTNPRARDWAVRDYRIICAPRRLAVRTAISRAESISASCPSVTSRRGHPPW
jgi:integrase/recombinase XerC